VGWCFGRWITPEDADRDLLVMAQQHYAAYISAVPKMLLGRRKSLGLVSHLLAGLVAFLDEHRYCGELDSGVEEDRVWMTCTCGAVISRTLEPATR
jgi:hypothetical protein